MSYDVITLGIRVLALVLAVIYAVRTTRSSQHRRSVTASLVVIGSAALVFGGLAPFGVVDASFTRVVYTAVAAAIVILCLTLLTVER